jgi:phosphatidate cytidylyltransferase
MLRRTSTALVLLAIILPAIYFGGLLFFICAAAFLLASTYEFLNLLASLDVRPGWMLTLGGVIAVLAIRAFAPGFAGFTWAVVILGALTAHLVRYEQGRDRAAVDFFASVAIVAYLGWIGAYMVDLRNLPDGGWWLMLVFPTVWLADTGAYMIGVRYGRHKMSPRLSPRKSWEGYLAGVVGGTLAGGFFAFAYSQYGPLGLNIEEGAILGLVLGVLTTLGDLGESLFKRSANAKDSGNIIPGHGGAFDRIDSLIWAAAIGFFWIRFVIR